MTPHPSSEQLSAWIADRLPSAVWWWITAHLAVCEECRAIVSCVVETCAEMERDERRKQALA